MFALANSKDTFYIITGVWVVFSLSTLYFWLAGEIETKQVVIRMSKWVEGGRQLQRPRIRAGAFYFSRTFAAQYCAQQNRHATQASLTWACSSEFVKFWNYVNSCNKSVSSEVFLSLISFYTEFNSRNAPIYFNSSFHILLRISLIKLGASALLSKLG